jgi:hypothetical protein
VTLVDESSYSIVVTLWGDICEKTHLTPGDIIALTGARISEYGGKSINAASDHADLILNPNHERARKLSFWYNDLISKFGQDAVNRIKSLTNKIRGSELPESRSNFNMDSLNSSKKGNSISVSFINLNGILAFM